MNIFESVETFFKVEKATRVAMSRKDFDKDNMRLIIDDVMGETPLDNPKLKKVLAKVDSMIGWKAVKAMCQCYITFYSSPLMKTNELKFLSIASLMLSHCW